MSLNTLVYVSTASEDMSDAILVDILDKARINNAKHDITGLLLYREGFFIQALEGQEDAIESLFARIKMDSRHTNVLQIYKTPIAERSFANWAMGFETANFDRVNKLESFSDFMQHRSAETLQRFVSSYDENIVFFLDRFRQ